MRTFVYVCTLTLFIAVLTPKASARVLGGDLQNGVAVYYFSSLTNLGNVFDQSGNGLRGALFSGAQLSTVSGRDCLFLKSNPADFQAWHDNRSLAVSKAFSIVAWVKIPQQSNDFLIQIHTYTGPIANIRNTIHSGSEGSVTIGVLADGPLFGTYAYNKNSASHSAESTGRHINNDRWQHIGFVVNSTQMKLYFNGSCIVNQSVSGHRSFTGTGSLISIGENAKGSVDSVGFFKNDLTNTDVRMIYTQGLANVINIAAVDPGGKVATTWGALKQQ